MQKKNMLFDKGNAPCHKSMKTMVKLNKLSFELLPHPPYSPDLALSIEKLEKRWNECITLEGNYVDK